MFFKGSRYLKVETFEAVVRDRRRTMSVRLVEAHEPSVPSEGLWYQVKQGDRLDLLAFKFYRTPRKWWLICDANPHLMYPDDLLQPGENIFIPKDRSR